ncbi:MAG: hypothetical protein CMH62_00170 [Nanoarchaeota archaeon]|nr:hypothetical protein [Nanoarchaeota archaeon]|tara:strand:- start:130 stop:600 length:471 start_codon:yes stop_codon:yes gene_type:complete
MNKRLGVFVLIIVLGISIASYFFFFKSVNCETVGCFESAASQCKRAQIFTQEGGGTLTLYKIKGVDNQRNCELYVKIEEVEEITPDITASFQGKDMVCKVPVNLFSTMTLEEMGSDLDYCTGPLKEEMYSVLVKKLYKLVLDDMGLVLEEVERVIG